MTLATAEEGSAEYAQAAEQIAQLERQQAAMDEHAARLIDEELGGSSMEGLGGLLDDSDPSGGGAGATDSGGGGDGGDDEFGSTNMWDFDFDAVPDDSSEIAFAHAKFGRKAQLDGVLANGFDVHTRNELSRTLAMEAAINDNKNILKLLHSYGADINLQDNLGNTALHYACQYKHDTLANYMTGKLGADDSIENEDGYDCWIWGEMQA